MNIISIKTIKVISILIIMFLTIASLSISARADSIDELQRKIDILGEEIDQLRMSGGEGEEGDKTHIHGYGELHYNLPSNGDSDTSRMDMHRMVIGLSHDFNESIQLHVEVDFEHAAKEIELEFAYLEFPIYRWLNIRAGSLLMPVGYLNEHHEPPLFSSVERPYVQTYIIPTTWQEGGIGIHGSLVDGLNYKLYVVSSLDASGFTGKYGIRKGRGKVGKSPSEDIAVTGRIEFTGIPGLGIGGSFYSGKSQQNIPADALVTLWNVDLKYKISDLEITGLFARTTINDAEKISIANSDVIGEVQEGWYVEGAYHLLRGFIPHTSHDLIGFFRWESLDTHKEVPSNFHKNRGYERRVATFGLAYKPIPEIAIKADYEDWRDGNETSWNQFNIGVTYMF